MTTLPTDIAKQIADIFTNKDSLSPADTLSAKHLVSQVIDALDEGELRVAEKISDTSWHTHQWVKQAILLYFTLNDAELIQSPASNYFDKVPLKFHDKPEGYFTDRKLRIAPGAVVRFGSYIGKNTVILPSFVNVGGYVDDNTMIDTWATVGSCAQIGKRVHISGGAGIGGVLEPLQANPTIIEDDCFIGARSEIVEGVIVGTGSVIGMGVFIGKSTKIFERATGKVYQGVVPPYSVVVSGSLPSKEGNCNLYAAIIVKSVDAKTKSSTSINELLRDYND